MDNEDQPALFPQLEQAREKKRAAARPDPLRVAVVELCHIDPQVYGWPRLGREIAPLRRAGVTPEQIVEFGHWYGTVFFPRGCGYPRAVPTVVRHWGEFTEWLKDQASAARTTPVVTDEQARVLLERYRQRIGE
jgi:hypothetical protein